MSCGEKGPEAQVLRLFDRQAGMLLSPMQQFFAQTLAGSARGIGAWEVAAAAVGLELAARACDATRFAEADRRLAGAIRQVQAAIRALLAIS
jgi:hypothetical protein